MNFWKWNLGSVPHELSWLAALSLNCRPKYLESALTRVQANSSLFPDMVELGLNPVKINVGISKLEVL